MSSRHRVVLLAAVLGLSTVLAGCGSDAGDESAEAPRAASSSSSAPATSEDSSASEDRSPSAGAAEGSAAPQALTERGGVLIGQDTAPVTVTVMSDFMCPACQAFEEENKAQLAELTASGAIKVEYVPVSILDQMSNGTQYSTRAAGAAYCVAETDRDKFVAFNDLMFSNQPGEGGSGMTSAELATMSEKAGVSEAGRQCITEDRYTAHATTVTERASAAGMMGTPTVYINDRLQQDWSAPSLRAAIDAAA